MTSSPVPDQLRFRALGPGVYDSVDGRVTLYRIEGLRPVAWNVEWTTDYQNHLVDLLEGDVDYASLVVTNIVDGAASKRDAVALAADAWPRFREFAREVEAARSSR